MSEHGLCPTLRSLRKLFGSAASMPDTSMS